MRFDKKVRCDGGPRKDLLEPAAMILRKRGLSAKYIGDYTNSGVRNRYNRY